MRYARFWSFIMTALILHTLSGCAPSRGRQYIDLSNRSDVSAYQSQEAPRPAVRIAVAPALLPREDTRKFDHLLSFLKRELDLPVEFVNTQTYSEINELVKFRAVDMAFVCGYAYVVARRDFGMELLAIPQVKGKPLYTSVVVVQRLSSIMSPADLEGKSFAFTDPLSFSGRLATLHLLRQMGRTPETFFGRHVFTYSHDNSIKAVLGGVVDGASVDSIVLDYWLDTHPEDRERLRFIARSQEAGIPPLVVHPALSPSLKQALRRALLTMHETEEGRSVLRHLAIDRFVPPDESLYAPMESMAEEMKRGS